MLNVVLMGPKGELAGKRIDISMHVQEEAGEKGGAEEKKLEEDKKMEVDEEKIGVLEQDAFWEELRGWLGTKLGRGEVAPEEVLGVFREAWKGRK